MLYIKKKRTLPSLPGILCGSEFRIAQTISPSPPRAGTAAQPRTQVGLRQCPHTTAFWTTIRRKPRNFLGTLLSLQATNDGDTVPKPLHCCFDVALGNEQQLTLRLLGNSCVRHRLQTTKNSRGTQTMYSAGHYFQR